MATSSYNVPIKIGDTEIVATSAGGSDGISLQALRSYGVGKAFTYNKEPREGSLNIDFYWTDDNLEALTGKRGKADTYSIEIGGTVTAGYLTDFSINVSADAPVTASASFMTTSSVGFSLAEGRGEGIPQPALGATSTIGAGSAVGVTYSLSQSFNVQRYLGSLESVVEWTDGSESLQINGFGGLGAPSDGICPDLSEETFTLINCSGTEIGEIQMKGFTNSRGFDVSPDGVATTNYELLRYIDQEVT